MATRKKKTDKDLLGAPEADPRAPFDTARFFAAARPVLALLERDLLERARASHGVASALGKRHAEETAAHRTADDLDSWTRHLVRQIAAAWLLSCVFVRVLEDRQLLATARIAGPGAEDSERAFYGLAPSLTPRDYLRLVFRELASFPAGQDLFDARHNPVWLLGPSAEASRALLALFRAPTAEQPSLRFGQTDTRFLGDLYQDLSEDVRERFALLQTPAFVERYILDRTLEPALARFGLEDTTLLDPTCGSGHFLLGAFDRLFDHWQRARPGDDRFTALREALARVHGADLNPYAVAIARFRLTLAFIEKGGFTRFDAVPRVTLNLAVADSLLHGPLPSGSGASGAQRDFAELEGQRAADWRGRLFSLEDDDATRRVLGRPHAAVVGNPPYIVVRDPALRDEYRKHYPTAYRQFSLGVPFTEKFFLLAKKGGYVGMITANSFMKREFGKKLIEEWVPKNNLTGVVNTAGAYIPGHGTPTVILFGTQEAPQATDVWAVLGKRGEPSTPDDPSEGLVWSTIRDHGEEIGFENDYVSVARIDRKTLGKHPWSLGGGGAAELKELLEARAAQRLADIVSEIGRTTHSGEDPFFYMPREAALRAGVAETRVARLVEGEAVRDWAISDGDFTLFPYDKATAEPNPPSGREEHLFWTYRTVLRNRQDFGQRIEERGLAWFEHSMFFRDRYLAPLVLAYAEVATHNHFVLDRGGKVFKQTAPIIKLKPDATEDEHYALLAYLNSSTACFWMKQVAFPKGVTSVNRNHPDPSRTVYAFSASVMQDLPLPAGWRSLAELGRRLDDLAQRRANARAERDWNRFDSLRAELVYQQEELDWTVYAMWSLTPRDLGSASPTGRALRSERPSEALSQQVSTVRRAGQAITQDDARVDDPSLGLSPEVARLWSRRAELLSVGGALLLIEDRVFKRLWRDTEQNMAERDYRASAELENREAETLESIEETVRSATRCVAAPPDVRALIAENAVPYLARLRYTDKGLEKRAAWERTWALQRREDAGETVGPIPVPPKYDPKDFRDPAYYRLRGKLDVPKERFISYPGCESDDDEQPLYGWAGWNHLQQAQALAALYEDRKREGWPKDRLRPMLDGLRELLPWLKQWHNEPSEEFGGLKLGDYFEGYVEGEERG